MSVHHKERLVANRARRPDEFDTDILALELRPRIQKSLLELQENKELSLNVPVKLQRELKTIARKYRSSVIQIVRMFLSDSRTLLEEAASEHFREQLLSWKWTPNITETHGDDVNIHKTRVLIRFLAPKRRSRSGRRCHVRWEVGASIVHLLKRVKLNCGINTTQLTVRLLSLCTDLAEPMMITGRARTRP